MGNLHEIRALIVHAITAITALVSPFSLHKKSKIMYQMDSMNKRDKNVKYLGSKIVLPQSVSNSYYPETHCLTDP